MARGWRGRVARRVAPRAFRRESLALAAVAVLAGIAVYALATWLFPYLSINHDEGVYLQQAAMLLDGTLWLEPPVPDAVRPWFFVQEGGRLYPKYSPVAAAVFAPGVALGAPGLVLVAVAVGNVTLVGLLACEAFDRPVAPLAAALSTSAPLFLLSSSVFLSYAPTTLFNALFALAYIRALRRGSDRYAVLAGVAVGVAFFSRPYTAVLFALPFVGHAVLVLARAWQDRLDGDAGKATRTATLGGTRRLGTVAALGAAFVGGALAYNWLVTGDPLVFPYQAFAPEDGIGFGRREILNYERTYSPALALRANGLVLWALLTRWGPLGPLGPALAAVGLASGLGVAVIRRLRSRTGPTATDETSGESGDATGTERLPDLTVRALLAALFVTVPAGNVYFWGNLNVLADLSDPTDGLIAHLGPFYHFDLLVPLAVFGAAGVLALWNGVQTVTARTVAAAVGNGASVETAGRVALAALLVSSLAVAGAVEASALGPPVERNAEYRETVASAYDPFESAAFDRALVFVPTPYGDWLNHPFQWLRNDPGFDGEAVYVLDRGADGDAASLAAFPDRQPYRFTYRGDWPPEDRVRPVLEPLSVRSGERLRVRTRVGVVSGAQSATVRLSAGEESTLHGIEHLNGTTETVSWVVGPERARTAGDGLRRFSDGSAVPVDGPTEVSLSVTVTQPGGATVTYRQILTVVEASGDVRALWPPETRVCRLEFQCGREGTYVEGGDYPAGVEVDADVDADA